MSIGKGLISALGIGRKKANQDGTDGSVITFLKQYVVSVNHASVAAVSSVTTSVTVTGASTDDVVISCEPQATLEAGIVISHVRVSAANTVLVTVSNVTAGAIDPAAINYKFTLLRIPAATR